MIIYKTVNLVNGKFYVGKDTKNNPNYLGSGKIFKQALKKYGKDNFKKEILEQCTSKEELNEREIYWIEKLNAIKNGYNIAIGGEGGDTISSHPNRNNIAERHSNWAKENSSWIGKKYSKEEKEILSNKLKHMLSGGKNPMYGKKHTEDSKKKMSNARIGCLVSDKTREKISKANKGKLSNKKGVPNPIHSKWMKENNPMKGKKHTDAAKKRISEANKHPKSEKTKRKISIKLKGNKPKNMIKVEIEGIIYESLSNAVKKTGIKMSTLRNRIKSVNYKNYKIYETFE